MSKEDEETETIIIEGKVINTFVEGDDCQILPTGVADTEINRFGETECLNCLLDDYENKIVKITVIIEDMTPKQVEEKGI